MTNSKNNSSSTRSAENLSNSNNQNGMNRMSFDSSVAQSKESINQTLDESKQNINRNLDEARNQIPRYAQEITDSQEQTMQTTKEIYENFLDYNKQLISSFQSAFAPYYNNICNQFWNSQDFFRRSPEIYSTVISNFSENAVNMNRMFNDIVFSNIRLYRHAINDAKACSNHLLEIGKRNAQAYESIGRVTPNITSGDTDMSQSETKGRVDSTGL
jgi:hypothetical protein